MNPHRLDRENNRHGFVVAVFPDDALAMDGNVFFKGFPEGASEIEFDALARQGQHVPGGNSSRCFEIFSGAGRKIEDFALAIGHHMGRRQTVEHLGFDHALQRCKTQLVIFGFLVCWRNRQAAGGQVDRKADSAAGIFVPLENTVLFVDHGEEIAALADIFRGANEKKSARHQRIVENRDHLIFNGGPQIDQQIAARDKIETRKRRIPDHAVERENAHVAHFLLQNIASAMEAEEPLAPFGRYASEQGFRVTPLARHRQCQFVDVGREDLHPRRHPQGLHVLAHQNSYRIDFLARRASRHPGPHDAVGAAVFEQFPNGGLRQRGESFAVPEEIRDADEKIVEQRAYFLRVFPQYPHIVFERVDLANRYPSLHPPQKRFVLVAREIVTDLGTDDRADFFTRVIGVRNSP